MDSNKVEVSISLLEQKNWYETECAEAGDVFVLDPEEQTRWLVLGAEQAEPKILKVSPYIKSVARKLTIVPLEESDLGITVEKMLRNTPSRLRSVQARYSPEDVVTYFQRGTNRGSLDGEPFLDVPVKIIGKQYEVEHVNVLFGAPYI